MGCRMKSVIINTDDGQTLQVPPKPEVPVPPTIPEIVPNQPEGPALPGDVPELPIIEPEHPPLPDHPPRSPPGDPDQK